ncbi:MAG: biotin--[acetyl-CoA-carboxylase] ligase, partial [Elusimicrobiota bacterium]|nr:biotin--[acetyl-CoA-carboxylase] ligase [Elusimicrobiota bacterium]
MQIIRLKTIDSTQNYAKKIAEKSVSGTIVLAEKQTDGRGQFEKTWSSQKGGLYFSIILKPKIETPDRIIRGQ